MKQRIKFEAEKNYAEALGICEELVDCQRKIIQMECANVQAETSELAQLLFMKGQAMERMGFPKEEILKI